ncbi:MAG: AAA family ATPase, partial [Oscillospiraceae bacterium]|nr:AAA family ATPase [Oscillospiraceae bacterium]
MNANNNYNGIAEIRLTQSLFQQGCFIPAEINLIIGRNGTGKSTFSGLIRSIEPLSFQNEGSAGEYRIMVFDRRYVLDNVMQYDSIPGIVTFSQHNSDIEQRIFALKSELQQNKTQLTGLQAALDRLSDDKSKITHSFVEHIWQESKNLRKQYEKALTGKKTKQKLIEALLAAEPHYQGISTLSSLYAAAFGEDKPLQPLLNTIQNINALDGLSQSGLLTEPIISSS